MVKAVTGERAKAKGKIDDQEGRIEEIPKGLRRVKDKNQKLPPYPKELERTKRKPRSTVRG